MTEKMTDAGLEEIRVMINDGVPNLGCRAHGCNVERTRGQGTNGGCQCRPDRLGARIYQLRDIATDIVTEVKRLRSEAIVWHPWPEETPEVREYWVTAVGYKGKKDVYKNHWTGRCWTFKVEDDVVIAFTELPAPYGGV